MTCGTCHGSGKCIFCGGDGVIDWMPPGYDNWCAACQGSGYCHKCDGRGWVVCLTCGGAGRLVHWVYNFVGATLFLSFAGVLLFLGLFSLSYVSSAFQLSFNEWVYDVEDMGFWFNRSFWTWLFAKHRVEWAKWQSALSLIVAIFLGILIFWLASLKQVTQETFSFGIFSSIAIVGLFAIVFYKSYISNLAEDTSRD